MNRFAASLQLAIFCLVLSSSKASLLAGVKVLYLGDSLSFGSFGMTLDKQMRQAGCEVYTMVTGGATPFYWLSDFEPVAAEAGHWVKKKGSDRRLRRVSKVPKVETILKTFPANVAVVQTGTNMYAILRDKKKTPSERVKMVEYLVDRMCRVLETAHCRIYWVTPPDSHVYKYPRELQEQMREIMKRVAGKHGRVFDSYAVTQYTEPYPKEDGIHYGPEEATDWARRVARDAIPWVNASREQASINSPSPAEVDPASELPVETVRKALPSLNEANTVKVEAILTEKTPFLHPETCTYRNAVACYEYKVVKVLSGKYTGDRLKVAHVVMRNSQLKPELEWEVGRKEVLTLVPLASYPDTEKLETLDELPDEPQGSTLPLLTPLQGS